MKTALQFIKELLGSGRYTFTLEEASQMLNKSGPALNLILQRLKKDGWIVPFARRFYIVLDVQHQADGILDPAWFIDDWARYHKVEYYVAGLSAAAAHSAAHQRPMVFQVMVDRQMRSITRAGLRLQLLNKCNIVKTMWSQRKSFAGFYRVSTPAMTAYDIVAYRRACPSLDLVASVLAELGEAIEPNVLALLPELGCKTVILQRLGWLLSYTGWSEKADSLFSILDLKHLSWQAVDPKLEREGERDMKWKIIVNTHPDIEVMI